MANVSISKKDVLWGYITIFFNVASGLIVLPFILRLLSAEEVGFNYLMLTIGQMVALFDAGFSPMYGKNISYVFSGATKLLKEGLVEESNEEINYHLLKILIKIAKYVYSLMSIIALLILVTGGSCYAYKVTDGFNSVHNSLYIWIVFSISTFFNIYFSYFNALLFGCGKITEARKSIIASKIVYITIAIGLLYCNMGLLGLSIANLIAPFIGRHMAYKSFFTEYISNNLKKEHVRFKEIVENFSLMWHNTKKMMIGAIGSYCINKASLFIAGFFLTLTQIGSYGLMLQFGGIITGISNNYFMTIQPKLASYMINGNWKQIRSDFSFAATSFLLLSIIGFICLIFLMPFLLGLIKSNVSLPSTGIVVVYSLVTILESNHAMCSGFIIIGNKVPSVWYSLIPGFFIILISWLLFKYTDLGIWGLVIAPGICQLACNNWKWPMEALKMLHMSIIDVLKIGIFRIINLKQIYVARTRV